MTRATVCNTPGAFWVLISLLSFPQGSVVEKTYKTRWEGKMIKEVARDKGPRYEVTSYEPASAH